MHTDKGLGRTMLAGLRFFHFHHFARESTKHHYSAFLDIVYLLRQEHTLLDFIRHLGPNKKHKRHKKERKGFLVWLSAEENVEKSGL